MTSLCTQPERGEVAGGMLPPDPAVGIHSMEHTAAQQLALIANQK